MSPRNAIEPENNKSPAFDTYRRTTDLIPSAPMAISQWVLKPLSKTSFTESSPSSQWWRRCDRWIRQKSGICCRSAFWSSERWKQNPPPSLRSWSTLKIHIEAEWQTSREDFTKRKSLFPIAQSHLKCQLYMVLWVSLLGLNNPSLTLGIRGRFLQ